MKNGFIRYVRNAGIEREERNLEIKNRIFSWANESQALRRGSE